MHAVDEAGASIDLCRTNGGGGPKLSSTTNNFSELKSQLLRREAALLWLEHNSFDDLPKAGNSKA